MKKHFICFIFILLSSCNTKTTENIANEFQAKVVGVKDGDTIEVLYNKQLITITLEHIDYPQKTQPFEKKRN